MAKVLVMYHTPTDTAAFDRQYLKAMRDDAPPAVKPLRSA